MADRKLLQEKIIIPKGIKMEANWMRNNVLRRPAVKSINDFIDNHTLTTLANEEKQFVDKHITPLLTTNELRKPITSMKQLQQFVKYGKKDINRNTLILYKNDANKKQVQCEVKQEWRKKTITLTCDDAVEVSFQEKCQDGDVAKMGLYSIVRNHQHIVLKTDDDLKRYVKQGNKNEQDRLILYKQDGDVKCEVTPYQNFSSILVECQDQTFYSDVFSDVDIATFKFYYKQEKGCIDQYAKQENSRVDQKLNALGNCGVIEAKILSDATASNSSYSYMSKQELIEKKTNAFHEIGIPFKKQYDKLDENKGYTILDTNFSIADVNKKLQNQDVILTTR